MDHVVILGGFTEHCVISTANALWSREIPAVIPASAVGPHNAGFILSRDAGVKYGMLGPLFNRSILIN